MLDVARLHYPNLGGPYINVVCVIYTHISYTSNFGLWIMGWSLHPSQLCKRLAKTKSFQLGPSFERHLENFTRHKIGKIKATIQMKGTIGHNEDTTCHFFYKKKEGLHIYYESIVFYILALEHEVHGFGSHNP